MSWTLDATEQFLRDFEKLGPNEQAAISFNLQVYQDALNQCKNPIHVQLGFLHQEPKGIRAVDQRGGAYPDGTKRPKMKEVRAYTYSNLKSHTLHLLCVGGKGEREQARDIRFASKEVERILQESEQED
ncbi:hypothetical protein OKA04_15685 [Luteolibacter flavescens]|uniref:Addiction module toxin RelE n=1 Tax=Luteolibacter flavescens TaxID=1859460 RepID=A0ABT3FRH1_9BACT|nr:hypothetical protein [Luteolibacter flavescens]MCW1886179.1 hypothetical protein [Luteolibacter flavescens]